VEPPKEELVRGKIWHKTYELINKSDESIVKSIKTKEYQDIYDMYKKNYAKFLRDAIIMSKPELKEFGIRMLDIFRDYWPNFDSEAKFRSVNLSGFISRHDVFGDELWDKLDPKIISEKYFKSETLNLSGIIDMIEVHNNEFYVPVEIKTGKIPSTGMWDGHRIQLAAYMLLLEDAGKKTGEGYLKYRGVEDKRILSMNTFLRDEVIGLINKVMTVINSPVAPNYVDNKNKCKSCPHRETCYDEKEMARLITNSRPGNGSL